MRAGEEVAGGNRQFFLFRNNIDLLSMLQGKEKVQEIAFKTKLRSSWDGSENIYTASLLSAIVEYQGEARGYLRAAQNWLSIYFQERKKSKDQYPKEERLNEQDVLEFSYAYLNINGVAGSVEFLNSLRPKEYVFNVVRMLAKRLIDVGRADVLHQYAEIWQREPYFIVAIAHELLKVGKYLKKSIANKCLVKLSNPKTRIPKPKNYFYEEHRLVVIIGFIEGCFHYKLDSEKIISTLDYYVPARANNMVGSNHSSKDRFVFMKALAIRLMLEGKTEVDIEEIVPENLLEKKQNHDSSSELKNYRESINGLLPWFLLRGNILRNDDVSSFESQFQSAKSSSQQARANRYGNFDPLPRDIAEIVSSILVLGESIVVGTCYDYLVSSASDFNSINRLELLRSAYRSSHLQGICDDLEKTTYDLIESLTEQGPDEMSERYVSLARAVVVNSIEDASQYFNQSVEIVSKFGEELVRRWEALESLADRAANLPNIDDELAYRFIRCAELVGTYVSREKHWSRSNAVRVDAKLSPTTAFAGISRWRDRVVGEYQYQLLSVVKELVKNNSISPLIAWSLTHFFENRLSGNIASVCLECEPTKVGKQAILDDAVRIMDIEGAHQKYVSDLQIIASRFNLSNNGLSTFVNLFASRKKEKSDEELNSHIKNNNAQPDPMWDSLFKDIKIDSLDGVNNLLNRFKNEPKDRFEHHRFRDILIEGLARISQREVCNYIDTLLIADGIDVYDVTAVLHGIPNRWLNKPALKAAWPTLIKRFGRHYAYELTSNYVFDHVVNDLQLSNALVAELKYGMYEGLQNPTGLNDEATFFGFCDLSASMLTPEDAIEVTDYGMHRFELHIEESFGDGPYNSRVAVESDLGKSVAGFIWSALGSPWGWERWNAVHSVRSLAELNCEDILEALFESLKKGEVGSYGSSDYIFYKFHAVQYFFIALARVSLSRPAVLVKYSDKISQYALNIDHLVIQKFATDTALNIAKAYPEIYDGETIHQLRQVGKSPFKLKKKEHGYSTDSIWHKSKEIDPIKDFYFSYDFDNYWFEPLGRVFGIPGKQVEDIAANVVVNEWKMGNKSGYRNDPRVALWDRSSEGRETWHDHGSYPKTDNLDFYMSYHSMMVAAAKLLKTMPIIHDKRWPENVWDDWLEGHLLTLEDGRWLSDIRGPLPVKRPEWTKSQRETNWQNDITERDFRERLLETNEKEIWITVGGGWHEKANERKEVVFVRSAFVASETSNALMRALQTCEDHHDYKMPEFEEDDMEFDKGNYALKGWLQYPSGPRGLDRFDKLSSDVSYPIISVGKKVMTDLQLVSEFDIWREKGKTKEVMRCENWSTNRIGRDEDTDQCGMRLKASLTFLTKMCKSYQRELIIEMVIIGI